METMHITAARIASGIKRHPSKLSFPNRLFATNALWLTHRANAPVTIGINQSAHLPESTGGRNLSAEIRTTLSVGTMVYDLVGAPFGRRYVATGSIFMITACLIVISSESSENSIGISVVISGVYPATTTSTGDCPMYCFNPRRSDSYDPLVRTRRSLGSRTLVQPEPIRRRMASSTSRFITMCQDMLPCCIGTGHLGIITN